MWQFNGLDQLNPTAATAGIMAPAAGGTWSLNSAGAADQGPSLSGTQKPGARVNSSCAVGSDGTFYVFGGYGIGVITSTVTVNRLFLGGFLTCCFTHILF